MKRNMEMKPANWPLAYKVWLFLSRLKGQKIPNKDLEIDFSSFFLLTSDNEKGCVGLW